MSPDRVISRPWQKLWPDKRTEGARDTASDILRRKLGAQGFYRVLSELAGLFRPWAHSTTPLTSAISQHFPTGNLRPVTRLYLRAKIDHVFDTRSRSRSIESREKTPRGIRLAQRMGAGRTAGLPKEPEHANSMLHECLAVSGGPASIPNPTT